MRRCARARGLAILSRLSSFALKGESERPVLFDAASGGEAVREMAALLGIRGIVVEKPLDGRGPDSDNAGRPIATWKTAERDVRVHTLDLEGRRVGPQRRGISPSVSPCT